MRPVAPLALEYRASAVLYLLVGLAGLAGDQATRDVEFVRSLVPFLIMAVITAAVLALGGLRWLRGMIAEPAALQKGVTVEASSATLRRVAIEVVLVAMLMVAGLGGGNGIGAIIAGVAAGAGLVNLIGAGMIARAEGARRLTLFRETPERLISSGRRPVAARSR